MCLNGINHEEAALAMCCPQGLREAGDTTAIIIVDLDVLAVGLLLIDLTKWAQIYYSKIESNLWKIEKPYSVFCQELIFYNM